MKKIITTIVAIACILAFPAVAYAKDKDVNVTGTSASTSEVTVVGATDALAVAIQLRDKDGNILGMTTTNTVSREFKGVIGELSLAEGEEYTVYVADYEGGNWTKVTVKAEKPEATTEAATTAAPSKSPKTGDKATPIAAVVLLGAASAAGVFFTKKEKTR